MEHVTAEEAKRLIDEEGAVLIDCREDYEWDEMRIPGATLVPLSEYEGDPEMVEESDLVIFQCATGNRSQAAVDIYSGVHPHSRALNLQGGIASWAAHGLPTDFGPPPGA